MNLDILFEGETRSKIAISSRSKGKKAENRVLHRCTNGEGREKNGQHLRTNGLIDNYSSELLLSNLASPHRKSMPSRLIGMDLKDSESLKRGSLYHSSKEVQRMLRVNNDSFLFFKFIDSLPQDTLKEDFSFLQPTIETMISLNLESKTPSPVNVQFFPRLNAEFLDSSFSCLSEERSKISFSCSNAAPAGSISTDNHLDVCFSMEEISSLIGKEAPELVEKVQVKEIKFGTDQLSSAEVDTNIVYGRDSICILPKSFSAKVETSNTFYNSENVIMKSSSKTRFSPFKKILDPIMKSKSLRNPILLEHETSCQTASDTPSLSRLKFFPNSLSNDLSRETLKIENVEESNKSYKVIKTATSLTHLHAVLKWDPNHESHMYEFSVKDPEDVVFAKIWKTENAFNWVYTFYSCKKRSKSRSHVKKDRHDQTPMIAQMQVSCYLCSEIIGAGSFDNSAVTEFTLYDIALARRSNAFDRDHVPLNSNQTDVYPIANNLALKSPSELDNLTVTENCHCSVRRNSSDFDLEPSTSYPWTQRELKPNLEIAAIVIQIPFSKKENLKNLQAGEKYNSGSQGLSDSSAADQTRFTINNHHSLAEVKVVTPIGRHGVPNSGEFEPSSLLDRWRFGGGCDCGGWDMGCPILVFDTLNNDKADSIIGTQQPIALLAKGKKKKLPALTITPNGNGQFAVDFHAQLSALQAFSICIAILHCWEDPSSIGQDNSHHKLYSDSLKILLEDEVRHMIEAIADNRKTKKRVEHIPSSFFLDPPFSPMGRV